MIDTNGVIKQEPYVIGSTGYDSLDDEAKEMIEAREFEGKDDNKAYWLKVEVIGYPDSCPTP